MKRRRQTGLCLCGSRLPRLRCCARFHAGELPETPLELMRSRYAAYALGDANYIIATTDPAGPMWEPDETTWRANIADFTSCTFRGVDILEHDTDGDRGSVRFRARLERDGEDLTFEEHSDFVRTGGRWLYHGPRGHVAG